MADWLGWMRAVFQPTAAEAASPRRSGFAEAITTGRAYRDEGSLADVLRPPFPSPVPDVIPASRPAAVQLEHAITKVPSPYRDALQAPAPATARPVMAIGTPTQLGVPMGPLIGYYSGLHGEPTTTGVLAWRRGAPPEVVAHELVHHLVETRLPTAATPDMTVADEELFATYLSRDDAALRRVGLESAYPPLTAASRARMMRYDQHATEHLLNVQGQPPASGWTKWMRAVFDVPPAR